MQEVSTNKVKKRTKLRRGNEKERVSKRTAVWLEIDRAGSYPMEGLCLEIVCFIILIIITVGFVSCSGSTQHNSGAISQSASSLTFFTAGCSLEGRRHSLDPGEMVRTTWVNISLNNERHPPPQMDYGCEIKSEL